MTTKHHDTLEDVRSHKVRKAGARSSSEFGMMGIPPYKEIPGEEYMNEKQRAHFRKPLDHNIADNQRLRACSKPCYPGQQCSMFCAPLRCSNIESFCLKLADFKQALTEIAYKIYPKIASVK